MNTNLNPITNYTMSKELKLYDTDYVWFDGEKIDMEAIYAEESVLEILYDEPLVGGEKFIKMTELPIDIQNEFIHKIKTNIL